MARTASVPGPRLSWSWGCLGAAGQHWGSSWGRIHSWPPVLAGQAAANSCQSWSRGTHSSAAPPLAFISQGNSQGKCHTAPHRPLAPHLLKVRHGERLVAPRYEFPEGGDDGSMSRRAPGARWQLVPTRARSGVTPTPAAASPAASCTAVLEQLPVGRC